VKPLVNRGFTRHTARNFGLAQRTIIRPLNKPVFDADVLMLMNEVLGWSPADYTVELKKAFLAGSTYTSMAHRRTRCVYIDYADEFHIDVVPYVQPRRSITNNKTDSYELSLPEQFNTWLDEKDRLAGAYLPEVIRLLKWLRDKRGNATKSLFLTVLVVERIEVWRAYDADYYSDVPTTFAHIVADLAEWLQDRSTLPQLMDPAGTGCNLSDRWDQPGYTAFRNWILSLAPKVAEAFAEDDVDVALPLWRNVFGSDFKAPVMAALVVKSLARTLPATEQWIDRTYGIPVKTSHTVSVVGRVRAHGHVNRAYDLPSRGNRVGKGRTIDFEVRACNVPEPFQVYWKVRNHGSEAADIDQLRGEITAGPAGQLTHEERTSYRGTHYVEVYVVKDGVCAARDRQEVVVTR